MRALSKTCYSLWTVSCQKFDYYIRMYWRVLFLWSNCTWICASFLENFKFWVWIKLLKIRPVQWIGLLFLWGIVENAKVHTEIHMWYYKIYDALGLFVLRIIMLWVRPILDTFCKIHPIMWHWCHFLVEFSHEQQRCPSLCYFYR